MHKDRKKVRNLRILSMSLVIAVITIGMIVGIGTGNLSAVGLKKLYVVCPLGYITTVLAGWGIMPRILICFLIIVGLTILLGRVFCGWVCPIPLERKLLKNKIDEPNPTFYENEGNRRAKKESVADVPHSNRPKRNLLHKFKKTNRSKSGKNSTYSIPVLIGVLASSAVFKFPVFCLICPIGLTFATLFALIHLIGFHQPTLDLLIFPTIIIVEILVLRKWCSKICPIGALLSLISRLNRRLQPVIDPSRCLVETKGIKCEQCRKACTYDIDLKEGKGSGHISECSKCKECAVSCPAQAIHFPWKKTTQPSKKKN